MDAAEFHASVYETIRRIPYGRVTSYGHIAKLVGMPRHSRFVGQALKLLPASEDLEEEDRIPWQRVIGSNGSIALKGENKLRQRRALEAEGVEVLEGRGLDGLRVDLKTYGWFPDE
ncbi:MGMT family protein [Flagelloscypha sp. PMI_526]|nr:MGMT family protein [Flagelloscypha sp. PMI_526]